MMSKLLEISPSLSKDGLFKNGSWGIFAYFIQTVLVSLFFIILARQYPVQDFANYLIATGLYQLLAAMSTLGLSQWFIREMTNVEDKASLASRFFKLQFLIGVTFFTINVLLAFLLYDERLIHWLSILVGANIVVDNLINILKCINIVEFNQKKTFVITAFESLIKFLLGCALFYFPFSILSISLILLLFRIISLGLFLRMETFHFINIKTVLKCKIPLKHLKELIIQNWPFIVIGSVSIINWRIANIIISKMLTKQDVAYYEISYKIFSIAQILPVIITGILFPILIRLYNADIEEFRKFCKKTHIIYQIFGLLSFTFIATFADFFILKLFGSSYMHTSEYTKQMFFTMLVFPTVYFKANMLVAMKMEKMDMWFNAVNLIINVVVALVGLYYFETLTVINFSIFISFLVFNILQDILLVLKKVSAVKHVLLFYLVNASLVALFLIMKAYFNAYYTFFIFWFSALTVLVILSQLGKVKHDFVFVKKQW